MNYKGDLVRPGVPKRVPLMSINSVITSTCAEAVDIMDGDNFAEALEANVSVSYLGLSTVVPQQIRPTDNRTPRITVPGFSGTAPK